MKDFFQMNNTITLSISQDTLITYLFGKSLLIENETTRMQYFALSDFNHFSAFFT